MKLMFALVNIFFSFFFFHFSEMDKYILYVNK